MRVRQRPDDRAGLAEGFTLIETLLVIALVSVLAILLVPSLALVRESARRARANSDLRSHAAIFAQYTADYKDLLPYVTDPRGRWSIVRCQSANLALRTWYFGAYTSWHIALTDGYYNGGPRSESFRSPWRPLSRNRFSTDYWYPCVFIADAAYWNPSTRRAGRSQLVPTKVSQVLFPASKTILFAGEQITFYGPNPGLGPVPTAFVDGSAGDVRLAEVGEQYRTADGGDVQLSLHFTNDDPFLHTIDGVRGRDVTRR